MTVDTHCTGHMALRARMDSFAREACLIGVEINVSIQTICWNMGSDKRRRYWKIVVITYQTGLGTSVLAKPVLGAQRAQSSQHTCIA